MLSSNESDLLNDESDKHGSDYSSSGTYFFQIFLCVFTSLLLVLVFCSMTLSHQQESSTKVVESLHFFGAPIPDFPSNFKISFTVIV